MPPKIDDGLPPLLDGALRSYVRSRRNLKPISLATVVGVVRYAEPNIALTDEELGKRVIRRLIALDCNIDFDLRKLAPPVSCKQ